MKKNMVGIFLLMKHNFDWFDVMKIVLQNMYYEEMKKEEGGSEGWSSRS